MRTFMTAVLVSVAGLTDAAGALAQTPAPAQPPAAATAAPGTAAAPAPAPAAPAPEAPASPAPPAPAVVVAVAPAAAAAAPAPPWWSSLSGDAFVDVYGASNWNQPRPQYGTTVFRAYDQAQGFSINWAGVDATYAADPIGGTVALRFGPAAQIHNGPATPTGTADNNFGLEYVRQAYATIKGGPVTLDAGKFDQPFGSEVPDSQLNLEYTRSLLYTLNQPLFFTGLRLDYAPTATIDAKAIVANGWNNSIDNNSAKTFAAQFSMKPIDQLQFYIGYAGGPEQADYAPVPGGTLPLGPITTAGPIAGSDSNWRHLVDLVVDINPTSALRFLLNADYDTERLPDAFGHNAIWYGANLAIKYVIADPFTAVVRGEVVTDTHGDIIAPGSNMRQTIESGTLTLSYVVASHFTLMLDNRVDLSDNALFPTVHSFAKSQFTTTLGVIVSTH